MIINLMKNKSDPRKVYKTCETLRANVNLELFDECPIESPVFKMTKESLIPDCNYLEVPQWGRKYFVKITVKGNWAYLSCSCDVLSSFFASCGNSPIIARRSTSHGDYRITDPRILKLPNPKIIYRKIGTPFTPSNQNNYVLTLSGKGN